MDHPPLPLLPPTEGPSHSAHSCAMPSTTRGEEESDDSKATLMDYQLCWRQAGEGEQKWPRSLSVDSEDTTPLQRRPRVATRKQRESAVQQGKSLFNCHGV